MKTCNTVILDEFEWSFVQFDLTMTNHFNICSQLTLKTKLIDQYTNDEIEWPLTNLIRTNAKLCARRRNWSWQMQVPLFGDEIGCNHLWIWMQYLRKWTGKPIFNIHYSTKAGTDISAKSYSWTEPLDELCTFSVGSRMRY